jgi:hypothetical protein
LKEDEMGKHVTGIGEMSYVFKRTVGVHKGKTPPGRPMKRWEDNIKK